MVYRRSEARADVLLWPVARRESVSRAMVVVEKYLRANVRSKGLARQADEYFHALYECFGAWFYDAHLDGDCFGALVVMVGFADFRLVHVF